MKDLFIPFGLHYFHHFLLINISNIKETKWSLIQETSGRIFFGYLEKVQNKENHLAKLPLLAKIADQTMLYR